MRSLVTPDLSEMQLWNTLTKGPLKENESAYVWKTKQSMMQK